MEQDIQLDEIKDKNMIKQEELIENIDLENFELIDEVKELLEEQELNHFEELYLSQQIPVKSIDINGVLLQEDGKLKFMKIEEVQERCQIPLKQLNQKLHVKFGGSLRLIKFFCEQIFVNVKQVLRDDVKLIEIYNEIVLSKNEKNKMVTLEWIGGKRNDMIADHLAFFLTQFPDDPECDIFYDNIKSKVNPKLIELLKDNFDMILVDTQANVLHIENSLKQKASLNLNTYSLQSEHINLQQKIQILIDGVFQSMQIIF